MLRDQEESEGAHILIRTNLNTQQGSSKKLTSIAVWVL